ncbi:MAG: aldehyde dehydrogenase family protein [Candidatus Aenigmarchaeota archaeon]|nr:aldehyde dehydrogenase family protein [Candidatus Aenigmarchaeota archaeon]
MAVYKNYIGGNWVPSSGGVFSSINPSTEKAIGYFQKSAASDVSKAVDAAEDAQKKWSNIPAPRRGEILLSIAQLLRKEKERLARLETTEMGKVLTEARGDVQEAVDIAEYMAGEGRRLFGNTTPSELRNKFCMTVRMPVGVVGIITPWNFPIAIPAWKLMPALVCGNAVVWKPSSDTPLCAVELTKLIEKAGVPKGVVNLVTGPGDPAGTAIVRHKKMRGISFTGSRDTGLWITQNAGIKKVGLELGGKNGIIIMDDADIDLALDGVIWGAFGTTGQRCTAASRVIVHEKIKKKFENALVNRARKLRLGSGLDSKTDVGPLVNKAAVEKSQRYVEIGKKEGAKLLCGGEKHGTRGFFYKPTVFTEVSIDMRIAKEEIFGPVLSIISFRKLEEAVEYMNAVDYGLSSSIYTNNIKNAFQAIENIEAGITYVNASTIGAEVHLPFGGVKQTGNGTREAGITGIEEFSEIKAVYIDYSGKLQRAQIDIER